MKMKKSRRMALARLSTPFPLPLSLPPRSPNPSVFSVLSFNANYSTSPSYQFFRLDPPLSTYTRRSSVEKKE